MMTKEQFEWVIKIQTKMQEKFRSTPEDGIKISHLGKEFVVKKNVFWPNYDSAILIENYKINPGEYVLDICTGTGVIAILSAYKGAKKVVAVDINPDAVENAKENVELHGFSDIIDVRLSDVFDNVKESEKFDVITANMPFTDYIAHDIVATSVWDTNLYVHKKFFAGVNKHLKQNGRIYICQANFGALEEMKNMAEEAGFYVKLIGEKRMPDDLRIYYAFELKRL